jgi:hypothetical protein
MQDYYIYSNILYGKYMIGGIIVLKKLVLMIGLVLLCLAVIPTNSSQVEAAEPKSGWDLEGNNWYYYIDNKKVTGWVLTGGKWYYLQPQSGIMSTNWVLYNKKWYYLDSTGAMKTGWIFISNKWYYLDHNGAMQTGWVLVNNKWYFLNPSGDMKIGWLNQAGKWYYLKPAGDMAVGWFVVNNKYYYTYPSGIMATNTKIGNDYVGYTGQWIHDTTSPYYLKGVLLVNKHHGLPSNYGTGENPQARAAYEQMKSSAAKLGYTLNIASGYRSFEYQKGLYWRYVNLYGQAEADRFSAYPGYSEHQTGLAFDIGGRNSSTWVSGGFDNTPEAKWLAKNAHDYGFILRYPPGKEHITGYMYESWHFRYLGVELATKVYNSGLTLEEYLGEF